MRCLLPAWPQCKTTRLIFDQRSLISLGWAGWAGCDICSLSPDPHHSLSCRRLPRHERAASAALMFVLMFSLSQLQHWPECPRQILYQDIIYADIMFTQIHNFTEKSPILQSLSKLVVSAQNKGKYYCWELNNKISNDNKTTLWYLIRSMYFTLLVFALWLSINCYVFSVSKYTWKKHLHKSIKHPVKSNEYILN